MNFFDFLNSINDSKKDLLKEDPLNEKEYNSFMVNRGLSHFADTIMYANEMNKYHSAPKTWQYSFFLYGIKKKKRFSKWHKKEKDSEDLELLKRAYGYSSEKASIALELLNEEQKNSIREYFYSGGRKK